MITLDFTQFDDEPVLHTEPAHTSDFTLNAESVEAAISSEEPQAEAKPQNTSKKSMTDIDNEKYAQVAERIIASIENGTSIWQKPWKASSSRQRPHNAYSGANYSGVNRVLLMSEMMARGSNDTRFMTYKQCRSLSEEMRKQGTPDDQLPHVRKGAESVAIYKFGRTQGKSAPVLDKEGNPVLDEDGKPKMKQSNGRSFLQTYYVFHASDIENIPSAPEPAPPHPKQAQDQVLDLVREMGVNVEHDAQNRAFYNLATDTIVMPERSQFAHPDPVQADSDYYSVLLHEAGHATGHTSRLNRVLTGRFGGDQYAYEELVADTTSAFLQSEIGLESEETMNRHAAYLTSWKEQIRNDPKALFRAFYEAEQASDWVMQRHPKQFAAKKDLELSEEPELNQGLTKPLNHDELDPQQHVGSDFLASFGMDYRSKHAPSSSSFER